MLAMSRSRRIRPSQPVRAGESGIVEEGKAVSGTMEVREERLRAVENGNLAQGAAVRSHVHLLFTCYREESNTAVKRPEGGYSGEVMPFSVKCGQRMTLR